jgi:Regulator of ribonuclease activity B
VLEELAKKGDVGAISREIQIWIYGSRVDLEAISKRLTNGWANTVPQFYNDRWSIVASRIQKATDDSIQEMVSEVQAALQGTTADFDGWETSVEIPH